jgi:hypothetical protein
VPLRSASSDADPGDESVPLYVEDEANTGSSRRRRHTSFVVAVACLVCAAAVGVPVALTLASGGSGTPDKSGAGRGDHVVMASVLSALSVTTDSGSYDMTYSDTTTSPSQCPEAGAESSSLSAANCSGLLAPTTGHGTVDTNPYAMVTVTDEGPLGTITLYDNGTDVWEFGGGDYGLAGPDQAGLGAPLSGFASSVEGTLGQVAGALDMQGLAGGTGYLDLETQEIQGVQPAGTGSVDGVPVTIYKLSESGLQDPDTSGLTPEQISTIRAADAIIESSGFAGKTTWISVDSAGYIREQKTEYTLPDGSTVTGDTVLSNFGCAGTVLMPGQQGTSGPPPGCVSPDTAAAPVATSTTSSTSTTSVAPTTQATVPLPTTSTTISNGPQMTTSTTTSSPPS